MNYTETDIRELAYFIWQHKRRLGLIDADNEINNWRDAQRELFLQDLVQRGSVGE